MKKNKTYVFATVLVIIFGLVFVLFPRQSVMVKNGYNCNIANPSQEVIRQPVLGIPLAHTNDYKYSCSNSQKLKLNLVTLTIDFTVGAILATGFIYIFLTRSKRDQVKINSAMNTNYLMYLTLALLTLLSVSIFINWQKETRRYDITEWENGTQIEKGEDISIELNNFKDQICDNNSGLSYEHIQGFPFVSYKLPQGMCISESPKINPVGFIANFIIGASIVLVPGLYYIHKRGKKLK